METWYTAFVNDKHGSREVAQSRSTDLGSVAKIVVQWTEISKAAGRNNVYAVACIRPLGFKGQWSKEQVEEFCSLTPEEAYKRLAASR